MLKRTYYLNDSKRPGIPGSKQRLDETSYLFWSIFASNVEFCSRRNKSKQRFDCINSIFEARNICFDSGKGGLLESFL